MLTFLGKPLVALSETPHAPTAAVFVYARLFSREKEPFGAYCLRPLLLEQKPPPTFAPILLPSCQRMYWNEVCTWWWNFWPWLKSISVFMVLLACPEPPGIHPALSSYPACHRCDPTSGEPREAGWPTPRP